jgi:hypothetical protein
LWLEKSFSAANVSVLVMSRRLCSHALRNGSIGVVDSASIGVLSDEGVFGGGRAINESCACQQKTQALIDS